MGWMAYVFPLLLFCGVAFVVSNKGNRIAYIKTIAGVVLLVQCCVLFELIDEKGGFAICGCFYQLILFREAAASYVLFQYLNGIVGDRKQRVYFI